MIIAFDAAQLLAAIPNGSASVFDRDFRYVCAAGKGLDDVGQLPETLIGKRLSEAFSPDAATLVEAEYRRAFDGYSVVFGLHYSHRTYSLSAAPFLEQGGRVEQIIVVAQDVTALDVPGSARPVPAVGSAEGLDADGVIATVGHELRNPLGAMRAAIAVIAHSADRPTRERARAVIERQLTAAETLINDLTELSRAKRGVLQLVCSDVSLEALISDARERVAHLAGPGGHEIVAAPCIAEGLVLRADRQRMLQVLTNLLTNAIRYTPAGGKIIVGRRQTPDSVSITITDSGKGIAPEALGGIFDRFERGHEPDSDGGLGIGLWVAREIVRLHGGRIDVFSAGIGQGATFTVRLPLTLLVGERADGGPLPLL
jgi:signal transduction histidine kinase